MPKIFLRIGHWGKERDIARNRLPCSIARATCGKMFLPFEVVPACCGDFWISRLQIDVLALANAGNTNLALAILQRDETHGG